MKLEIDGYTKFILTVIAFALLLNAASPLITSIVAPKPVHGAETMEVKIVDVRSTWPQKIEISNWPRSLDK